MSNTEVRVRGRVKFFNDEKGFGFIMPEEGGKDIFVHRKDLVEGVDTLLQDQAVSYVVGNNNHKKGDGTKATMVKVE